MNRSELDTDLLPLGNLNLFVYVLFMHYGCHGYLFLHCSHVVFWLGNDFTLRLIYVLYICIVVNFFAAGYKSGCGCVS